MSVVPFSVLLMLTGFRDEPLASWVVGRISSWMRPISHSLGEGGFISGNAAALVVDGCMHLWCELSFDDLP